MKNLKNLLTQPLQKVPTKLVVLLFVIALLGFADATYLTTEHYLGVVPPCSVVSGCEVVLTSSYATVAGVPVSLLGSIYYFVVLICLFAYLEGKKEIFLRFSLLLTILGFLASLKFLLLMAFILNAYCLYCLGSVLSSTLLFVIAVWVFKKYRNKIHENL